MKGGLGVGDGKRVREESKEGGGYEVKETHLCKGESRCGVLKTGWLRGCKGKHASMTRACMRARPCLGPITLTKCSNSYALSLALLPQPFSVSVSPQSLFLSVTPPLSHLFSRI